MSVNLSGAHIALEATRGKVDAESTQRGAIKCLLKMFLALLEHRFAPTPLGEQRRKNQNQENANQNEGLRGEDAVCKRHARVAKVSHAKDRRPQDRQRHDKGRRGCKHRSATYGNPEQQRKDEGHGQRRCPRPLRQCYEDYAHDSQGRHTCCAFDQLATRRRLTQGLTQSDQNRCDRDDP